MAWRISVGVFQYETFAEISVANCFFERLMIVKVIQAKLRFTEDSR